MARQRWSVQIELFGWSLSNASAAARLAARKHEVIVRGIDAGNPDALPWSGPFTLPAAWRDLFTKCGRDFDALGELIPTPFVFGNLELPAVGLAKWSQVLGPDWAALMQFAAAAWSPAYRSLYLDAQDPPDLPLVAGQPCPISLAETLAVWPWIDREMRSLVMQILKELGVDANSAHSRAITVAYVYQIFGFWTGVNPRKAIVQLCSELGVEFVTSNDQSRLSDLAKTFGGTHYCELMVGEQLAGQYAS